MCGSETPGARIRTLPLAPRAGGFDEHAQIVPRRLLPDESFTAALGEVKALLEADAWPGPSLVIAYSTCIAHGIDMSKSMSHQKDAVKSGYWPLYRFQPTATDGGQPSSTTQRASLSRPRGVRQALAWDMKTSGL